jgi:hypothetical protein
VWAKRCGSLHQRYGTTKCRNPTLRTVQASFGRHEILLEYVLGESQSYCLRITRSDAKILVLHAGRKTIKELVDDYLAGIRSRQREIAVGKELFALLLQPVIGSDPKPSLIVATDG